ncbi:MAG: GNAT family N-acetyltransferase [Pseudomonadota bacterium]
MGVVRRAYPSEAPALSDLAFRSKAHWGYDASFMDACRAELTIDPARCEAGAVYVYDTGGGPRGVYDLSASQATADLELFYIDPAAMGRGIGRKLFLHLKQRAHRAGLSQITIDADPNAARFYEHMGAHRSGSSPSGSIPGRFLPRLTYFLPGRIALTNASLDMRVDPAATWPFEASHATEIAEHWQMAVADNPALFNGPTLMAVDVDMDGPKRGGRLNARFASTRFAAFLAWREWGFCDVSARNIFGSAVIYASDGALLFGVMGGDTANAGRCYPPGGSLDPDDVAPDGRINMTGSIARELQEETGLFAGDATDHSLLVIDDGPRLSVAQMLRFDSTADQLADDIRRTIATQEEPELADIHILRSTRDMDAGRMPGYAQALVSHVLPGDAPHSQSGAAAP